MLARFTRFCSLFIAALVFWGLSFCKDYLKSLALQTSPFIPKTSKKLLLQLTQNEKIISFSTKTQYDNLEVFSY